MKIVVILTLELNIQFWAWINQMNVWFKKSFYALLDGYHCVFFSDRKNVVFPQIPGF